MRSQAITGLVAIALATVASERCHAFVDVVFQDGFQQHIKFQIQSPNIPIAAGDAQTYCYFFLMPNSSAAGVRHWLSHMDPGIQHAILFSTPNAAAPAGTLTQSPCSTFPGEVSTWLYATHDADEDLVFPTSDGAGHPLASSIPSGQPAFLQIYLKNDTEVALDPTITISADAFGSDQTFTTTAAYLTVNTQISLPPGSTNTTVQNTCAVPSSSRFWWLSTRTHRLAVQSGISDNGNNLVSTLDWSHPSIATFSAPQFYQFTSGLKYSCTYDNFTNNSVAFGDSEETDEVCFGIGFFFPATSGGQTCINSTGPM